MKSVTIGISAYNEENNINQLIQILLTQLQIDFKIKQILLISDGSTDNTVRNVKKINSNIFKIIDNKERKGLACRLNQIIASTNTDILVILNADIVPKNSAFIYELVKPIINNEADLTSAKMKVISNKTLFEKISKVGCQYKTKLYENYRNGKNVYTCNGTARALSNNFYKNFYFEESVGEDAFSYFSCINRGLKYFFTKKAILFYKIPENFSDYLKQSVRFTNSKNILYKKFNKDLVNDNYYLPKSLIIKNWVNIFLKSPIHLFFYTTLVVISRLRSVFVNNQNEDIWETSTSTKNLVKTYEY